MNFEPSTKISSIVTGLLSELSDLDGTLYLTGSRFFGGVHSNSDWDFFADITTPNLLDRLCDIEFQIISLAEYTDKTMCMVFERKDNFKVVQIQVVREAKIKFAAQSLIAESFPFDLGGMSGLNKQDSVSVWNNALWRAKAETRLG